MQTLSISIADELKRFMDQRIADGSFASISEYLSELIRADEKRITDTEREMTNWLRSFARDDS